MKKRVAITGRGTLTTLGDDPVVIQRALCAGRSGLQAIDLIGPNGVMNYFGGQLTSFAPQKYLGNRMLRALDRTSLFLASAAQLALRDAELPELGPDTHELGLVVGTMFSSMQTVAAFDRRVLTEGPRCASAMDFANTVLNAAAGQTAIRHGLRQVNTTITTGACSGLRAVGYAADCVRSGQADMLLAGGVEELSFESVFALAGSDSRAIGSREAPNPVPFGTKRNGAALSEGAAVLVLEDLETAVTRGAPILAEIMDHSNSFDYRRMEGGDTAAGSFAASLDRAVRASGLSARDIDFVSSAANGSPRFDRDESIALHAVFGESTPVTAIKSMHGEALGAGGALQLVAAVEVLRDGLLPGVPNLAERDAHCQLDVTSTCRELGATAAVVHSAGRDGFSSAIVVRKAP